MPRERASWTPRREHTREGADHLLELVRDYRYDDLASLLEDGDEG